MFQDLLASTVAEIEATLDALLPVDGPMAAPMRHAALSGGKRLRGFLCVQSSALYDVPRAPALRAAAAIECLHAYSLVHDDLPAMDDDALRRGQPTVHIKWDEATAILAGDALQSLAFEILADPATGPYRARADLVASLAVAARAMVDGQAQDIAAETAAQPLTLAEISDLQARKTGALIAWSAQAGPRLAHKRSPELDAYARAIGLAFQIQDDVLDEIGDETAAGKRLQKDADAGKATFVSHLGLEDARARAKLLVDEACDALSGFGDRADPLRELATFIVDRDR